MKKFIIGLITGVMLTASLGVASAATGFTDSGWWSGAANWAKSVGIMNGYPDGSFGGDKPVTRGELATVLKNMADKGYVEIPTPTPIPAPTFADKLVQAVVAKHPEYAGKISIQSTATGVAGESFAVTIYNIPDPNFNELAQIMSEASGKTIVVPNPLIYSSNDVYLTIHFTVKAQ